MIIANNGKNDKVGTKYVLLTLLSFEILCVHILTLALPNIAFPRNTKYDAPNIHFISYTFSIMSLKEPKSLSVEIMNRKLTLLLF